LLHGRRARVLHGDATTTLLLLDDDQDDRGRPERVSSITTTTTKSNSSSSKPLLPDSLSVRGGGVGGIAGALVKTAIRNPVLILRKWLRGCCWMILGSIM